jgi:uncharacterized protein YqfA (UPF0365 family)
MTIGTYRLEYEMITARLDEASAQLDSAVQAGQDQQGRLAAATGSSARPEAEESRARVAAAQQKVEETTQALMAAKIAIESYINTV